MNGIKRLRLERSMSQEELAMKLNVSQQAITKWENGGRQSPCGQAAPFGSGAGLQY